jgi:hypothetical protein
MRKWIKNLNPGLNTENGRILDKQSELKGQRLILHRDRDSLLFGHQADQLKDLYRIFTGNS